MRVWKSPRDFMDDYNGCSVQSLPTHDTPIQREYRSVEGLQQVEFRLIESESFDSWFLVWLPRNPFKTSN